VNIKKLHDWEVKVEKALEIQSRLSGHVVKQGDIGMPRFIAGVDVSVNFQNAARAAAVVLTYPEMEAIEAATVVGRAVFPYIPGLLSFREVPLTLEACKQLKHTPDLIMVDGQGIAHPRRIGLASHLGLFLDIPTIGCAKSLLVGSYRDLVETSGAYSEIIDKNGEIIGAALRTKSRVKPLFVSIGHKIDLPSSIYWVLQCVRGFRLPEPTRLAHLASRQNLKLT
jgi:deoxyribonuclease V